MGHCDAAGHRAEYVERDSQRVLAFRGSGPWRVHVCQPADVREPAGGDRIRRTGERRDLDRGCGSLAALRLRAPNGSVLRRPAAGTNGPRRGDHRRPGVPNPSSPRLLHRRAEVTATQAGEARAGVEVRLEDLRRSYAGVTALDGLSLTLAPGELVALLGPSGCGKTTAMRLVAGLEEANSGRVMFGGRDVTGLPANKRDVGMVFQAYSLFPHMAAWENVAFGLQIRHVATGERKQRALDMLELVGLGKYANRYPSQLSGGQQQRVALARALAIKPKVLLLDEPLSAPDAKVRARLRDESRRVQPEVGITTLFVTHDQEEALAIADRVGVMQSGHLEQLGPPTEIYSRPATPFVAEFVGLTNRIKGEVHGGTVDVRGTRIPLVDPDVDDGPATALVRPEAVTLASNGEMEDGPLVGTVIAIAFLGAMSRVTVDLGDTIVLAQMATSAASQTPAGTKVRLTLRPDPVLIQREQPAATAP